MSIEFITKEIINLINEPNENSIDSMKIIYQKGDNLNIHNAKSIVLVGNEKIKKYNDLFLELYNKANAIKYRKSFRFFQQQTEQFLFSNEFNETKIKEFVSINNFYNFFNIQPIYGMNMEEDIIHLGKYTFINKNYILEFIEKNVEKDNVELYEYSIDLIKKEIENSMSFIYLMCSYEVCDSTFANELFLDDVKTIITTLNYITAIKDERIYISDEPNYTKRKQSIQFTNQIMLASSYVKIKDDITLNEYFYRKDNGNAKIWEILSKTNRSDIENRICKAIKWVGLSIIEKDNDIACTELAFAYECLLKIDLEQQSPISSSIQGSISEMLAYLCGNSLNDRKEIIKEFKQFYSARSSIVHSGVSKYDNKMYLKFLLRIKSTILILLTDEKYKSCNSLKEINSIIEDYKYRM